MTVCWPTASQFEASPAWLASSWWRTDLLVHISSNPPHRLGRIQANSNLFFPLSQPPAWVSLEGPTVLALGFIIYFPLSSQSLRFHSLGLIGLSGTLFTSNPKPIPLSTLCIRLFTFSCKSTNYIFKSHRVRQMPPPTKFSSCLTPPPFNLAISGPKVHCAFIMPNNQTLGRQIHIVCSELGGQYIIYFSTS